ncbi:MAG: hypothetical protein FWE10_08310 [Rikenellaceae bacterium]|nr:hypothetical protein [Rikenellaceae bacterium]
MKKRFPALLLLSVIGAVVLYIAGNFGGMFDRTRLSKQREANGLAIAHHKTERFSVHKLDSLVANNEFVILGIGLSGCGSCDDLLLSPVPQRYGIPLYFINKEYDNNNRLVAQALYASSNPTSYILDSDMNVRGIIRGTVDYEKYLDDIVNGSRLHSITIGDHSEENSIEMMSNALRGLMIYMRERAWSSEDIYGYARKSLTHGEYFFNNYLLHRYFDAAAVADSAEHYRLAAIGRLDVGLDVMMFRRLIEEIDPTNEKLDWFAKDIEM